MRNTKQNCKDNILRYVKLHREGITVLDVGHYVAQLTNVNKTDFEEVLFELLEEKKLYQINDLLKPLPDYDQLPELFLLEEQQKTLLQLITFWYEKWRHTITDDHHPHRLGFAKEDLLVILTCDRALRQDAQTRIDSLRRRSPQLAQVIEGRDAPERE